MPKTATVSMGGREYVISEKVMGVSAKWREALRQSSVMRVFESLDDALSQIVGAINDMGKDAQNGQINFAAGVSFAAVAPAILRGLSNSIDDIVALLYDYSPELKADADYLAENAYNEEAIEAFIEVLKLNFPIMAFWGLVRGSRAQATSTNLPAQNGAGGGTKRHSARSKAR